LVGVLTLLGFNRTELLYCWLARLSSTLVCDLNILLRLLDEKISAAAGIGIANPKATVATQTYFITGPAPNRSLREYSHIQRNFQNQPQDRHVSAINKKF